MNNTTTFFNKIKNNPNPIVIDVWAPWCMPCKMIEPSLEKLGKEYAGKVDIWRINADENPEISKALKVRAIPTLIGFKDGEEVARSIGNKSYKALAQFFEGILTGEEVKTSGLTMTDRVLRFFAGIVLLFIAWWGNNSVVLYTISVIVIFSAFYDRCPIWQTLTIWISNLVHRKKSKE